MWLVLKHFVINLIIDFNYEKNLIEEAVAVDVSSLKNQWLEKTTAIFDEATLVIPQNIFAQTGGKQGIHSEHLGYILAEMQFMQRAYPNSVW
jgi:ring-1,2-phenylacetyl-CoA epoxidase subunit PaaC